MFRIKYWSKFLIVGLFFSPTSAFALRGGGGGGSSSGSSGSSLPLPGGATNYIQNTNSLQSGSTFYVSSGTVGGQFIVRSIPSTAFGHTSSRMVLSMNNSTFNNLNTLQFTDLEGAQPNELLIETIGNDGTQFRGWEMGTPTQGLVMETHDESNSFLLQGDTSKHGEFDILSAGSGVTTPQGNSILGLYALNSLNLPIAGFYSVDGLGGSTKIFEIDKSSVTLNVDLVVNNTAGNSGQVLTSNGAGSVPTWQTPSAGGGGTSTLEVFSNYMVGRTSPTASIGVGNGLATSVSGSTFTFKIDYSSVPSRSDVILNQTSLQSGANFNTVTGAVSTMTVGGSLQITGDVNDTYVSGRRNRFINGDMVIDQQHEGASFTVSGSANVYGPDMFFGYTRGHPGQWSVQQLSASPPDGFRYYIRSTITTADATGAADDEYVMSARIEGVDVQDFMFGTSTPKTITTSFWVRTSSAGVYSFANGNSNSAPIHYYVSTYTVATANVWQYVTLTVPGDTQSNWNTTIGTIGLKLIWDFGDGVNLSTTTSGWTSNLAAEHMVGSNKIIAVNGATFDLTGVQVEIGSHATKFESHPHDEELRRCQRYYEKSYAEGIVPGANTGNGTGSNCKILSGSKLSTNETDFYLPYKVKHYALPTVTFYAADGTSGKWKCFDTTGASSNITITATEIEGVDGTGFYQSTDVYYFCLGHYTASSRIE